MSRSVKELAEEIATLTPAQFAELVRRVADERLKRCLPVAVDEELIRQEDLALSHQILATDWEGVPDDWEARGCPSSEAK